MRLPALTRTMLWTGFKKAINRAGTTVLTTTGKIDTTHDKEFEFNEKRLHELEHTLKKLELHTRNYLAQLDVVQQGNANLSNALALFYGANPVDDPTNAGKEVILTSYSQKYAVRLRSNQQVSDELEQPYYHTVVNPIAKFNGYYKELDKVMKKRHRKLLDYDAVRSKLEKLEEKEPEQAQDQRHQAILSETREMYAEAESIYEDINERLKVQLPQFMNHRVQYFDPLFEAFVKCQWRYFDQCQQQMTPLKRDVDPQSRQDYEEGRGGDRLDRILDKMKLLTQ